MRFLVDECTGAQVAQWLKDQGHDVFSIYDDARGAEDPDILAWAFNQNRILVSNDKGFGTLIFHERRDHVGVILLRLADESVPSKIAVLAQALERFAGEIEGNFVVATEENARLVRFPRH